MQVKNQGYVGGNKRVGFAVAATFLLVNGARLAASEPEACEMVVGVKEGVRTEAALAAWIRAHLVVAR